MLCITSNLILILDVNGEWEQWGSWTSCSKPCVREDGEWGSRSRDRGCTSHKYGGDPCDPTGFTEAEKCAGEGSKISYCPVDGKCEEWSNWSSCSKTCGGGTKTSYRFCNEARHDGVPYEGERIRSEGCNPQGCGK